MRVAVRRGLSTRRSAALLAVLAGGLVLVAGARAADLFVAPGGDDSWPGTRDRPFATFERARDAVRQARVRGELGNGWATVWIRGGTYFRTGVFALGPEDSGTDAGPVIYRSAEGETVRIIGGRTIDGFGPVTDVSVLRRLEPRARSRVLQAVLPSQGILDFGELAPRGYGRPRRSAALEIFFRGTPMTPARWPDRSFAEIEAVPGADGLPDPRLETVGAPSAGFHYSGSRPARWRDTQDIWIHGYWAYDWADSHEGVASIDLRRNLVTVSSPDMPFGFRPGQRFYFSNILEELDAPGEWYLDRRTGTLYFWPPARLREGDVTASLIAEPLVLLERASDIELRGLTFEAGRSDAVRIVNGLRVGLVGCAVRGMGQGGVLVEGGSQVAVRECDISQTGEAAVWLLGGDRGWLTPAGLEAVGNNIHSFGRWCRCYQPAVMVDGVGNRVARNRLSYGPHVAVQLAGNDHLIEYNEIDHVCTETGDAGAFYMGRDWTYRGNVVRFNHFHDIQGVDAGAAAVYLDDLASGTTVFGNLFVDTRRGVVIGGGRDNRIENNLFVGCRPAVTLDDRGTTAAFKGLVETEMRERLEAVNPHQPPYGVRYPGLAELDYFYASGQGVPPGGNLILRNIIWAGEWLRFNTRARETGAYASIGANLVGVDPLFVNPGAADFRLRPESPAFEMGFSPIPYDGIGLPRRPIVPGSSS